MYELCIRDEIASAHLIRGYEGKCQYLHGHTWKVEVFLESAELNELGMAEDFAVLKRKLKKLLSTMDHKNLNDLEMFQTLNPTAENMAKVIFDAFAKEIVPLRMKKVKIWESDRAFASYYE